MAHMHHARNCGSILYSILFEFRLYLLRWRDLWLSSFCMCSGATKNSVFGVGWVGSVWWGIFVGWPGEGRCWVSGVVKGGGEGRKLGGSYPLVRRVLGPRDLVKKITRSGKYPSLTGNKLLGFQTGTSSANFLGALTD
ncbi:hypothetical protein L873DRAFT_11819 [Choiromyces venosus 120613-1]|uniref:Uncharacterized protein n=1 Tax=Choiromyces venosus 120613-1 TaxID=1336337 RepID=A0A3N4K617_9PEZI|nr:hypothetical protein L873DRAFT_11819 [Choiromyces venosus 120613-1]